MAKIKWLLLTEAIVSLIYLIQSFTLISILPSQFVSSLDKVLDSLQEIILIIILGTFVLGLFSWIKEKMGETSGFEFSTVLSWVRPALAAVSAGLMTFFSRILFYAIGIKNMAQAEANFFLFALFAFDVFLSMKFESFERNPNRHK